MSTYESAPGITPVTIEHLARRRRSFDDVGLVSVAPPAGPEVSYRDLLRLCSRPRPEAIELPESLRAV